MFNVEKITIPALDTAAMEACRLRIDNLSKPIYSLAHLELMAERLAGITQVAQPNKLKKHVLIWAADHAVDGPQNQTHGQQSLAVLETFDAHQSATEAAAQSIGAPVSVVDIGLEQETNQFKTIETHKIANGSHFFGKSEALEGDCLEAALQFGTEKALELQKQGVQVVALGNIGEREFLGARAITYILTGTPIEDMLEPSECGLTVAERAERLTRLINSYQLTKEEPLRILQCFGGLDIAAMVGFILTAASKRMAVVIDNAVTGVAALVAFNINKGVRDYLFTSAVYTEPIQAVQLKALNLKAFLHYDFKIDEGLGSTMGLSLLDASLHMLNDMKTFGEATVAVAEDGPGNHRQDGR